MHLINTVQPYVSQYKKSELGMPFQEPLCEGSETLVNDCTYVSLGDG